VRYSLLSDLLYYLLWYNMIGLSLIVWTLHTAQTARTLQSAINFVFDQSTKIMHFPENKMHTIISILLLARAGNRKKLETKKTILYITSN